MDQLSSCYFCGGALDVSLAERPVVPEALQSADEQQTVVLCGSCKRKLDAVVDRVVAAADERAAERLDIAESETSTESPADDASNAASGSASASDDGEGTSSDIESTLGDDEDVLQPVGDRSNSSASNGSSPDDEGDSGGRPSDDSSGEDDEPAEKERKYTSSRRAGYTREESRDSGIGGSGDGESDDSRSDDGGSDAGDGADDGSSDEASADEPDRVTMTRLENTKVMRLLQNREFPVERDGFVTVASSAYEVSPGDCDKVIDLAIQHDLLREENGQIVAGPEWG